MNNVLRTSAFALRLPLDWKKLLEKMKERFFQDINLHIYLINGNRKMIMLVRSGLECLPQRLLLK